MSDAGERVDGASTEAGRRLPWDLHPALTEDRLSACARLLARGRSDAVAMADPWAGDDAWSIGCRAYSFSRNRLRQAAEGGRYPWLGVLDETHHFVFLIDGVPVRFFRGDAEEPSKRTLRQQDTVVHGSRWTGGDDRLRQAVAPSAGERACRSRRTRDDGIASLGSGTG